MYSKKTFKGFVGDNKPAPAPDRFLAWGNLGQNAQKQGWYPSAWNNETVSFKNRYNNNFNEVVLPGNKRGYVEATGGIRNNVFDVSVKDENGNVVQRLLQKVSPEIVDQYFRSSASPIAQRVNSISAGTNPDRRNPDGSYVAASY